MEKLWIVSELFYPEETSTSYLLTKIANAMSNKYDVNVICCNGKYDKEKENNNKDFNVIPSINIIRIKGSKINKNSNYIFLLYKALKISLNLSYCLFKRVAKHDKVLIVTTPVFLLLFITVVKKIKGIYWSVLVYDVFPENIRATGKMKNSSTLLYKLLKKLFDKSYSYADKLIVIGRDMEKVMRNKIGHFSVNTEISIIENWAEVNSITPRISDNKDKITLLYAGNMGRVQGLLDLINIISLIRNDELIFSFRGTGALKSAMMDLVKSKKIRNVLFDGGYSRNKQSEILGSCDIALITLADEMYGLAVPSKSYNIMAAGKPILYIGNSGSEIWKVVSDNKIGFCFQWTEKERLIEFLNNLSTSQLETLREMGNRARKLAEYSYSESVILGKYLDII